MSEPIVLVLTAAMMLVGLAALVFFAWRYERKRWNGGLCRSCGKPWRLFDAGSRCGRGYVCDDCLQAVWVTYPFVDRGS